MNELMLELLALLLPVAAASGWFVAIRHYRRLHNPDLSNSTAGKSAKIRGLNYRLNEKLVSGYEEIDATVGEAAASQIALGNLFRRNGEVERAIKLHQELIKEASLNEEQHGQALFELGMDYLRAGLFDRAEHIFVELTEDSVYGESAVQQLLQIYQHEKDWHKAIECTNKLRSIGKIKRGESIAHFYCELAQEALNSKDIKAATFYIKETVATDSSCARASLVFADIQIHQRLYREALKTLQRVEIQNPAFIPETISPMMECYKYLGNISEQIEHLSDLQRRHPLHEITAVLVTLIRERDGIDAAIDFMSAQVKRCPSLRGLHNFIVLLLEQPQIACQDTFEELKSATSLLLNENSGYRCTQCGFSGAELHWRCPSCHHWETIKLKKSE